MYRSIKTDISNRSLSIPQDVQGLEMEEKRSSLHHNVPAKNRKTLKGINTSFWGAVNCSRIFALSDVFWKINPPKSEG
jgi:hypothetical protein